MNDSIRLYSVYYKSFPLYPKAPYVTPIQAGKAVAKEKMEILGDDTGENLQLRTGSGKMHQETQLPGDFAITGVI